MHSFRSSETDEGEIGLSSRKGSHNFLVQGSILAVAAIIAKAIGVIYRIPLTNILGDSGNSYYSTANEVYSIILMISSFSLPLAISRMMSERIGKGEYRNAYRVFLCAIRFAVLAGGIMALLTWLLSGLFTKYVLNFEMAKYALQVISPAILIFAITGTFRGFFQGFGTMVPTAVSQVIEQIINAVLSVVCAGLMFSYGRSLAQAGGNSLLGPAWGAAGGAFGTVGSVTIAMIFMMIMFLANRKSMQTMIRSDNTDHVESSAQIYYILLITILPIVLSTLIYNISNVIDQGIFNAILKGQGYNEEQYSVIWGIYTGKYRVLMNVVLSLASSIGPAIVPALTIAMSQRKKKEVKSKVDLAIRFTMLFSIPCAFGLAALAGPIITMLFHPTSGMPLCIGIMQAGAPRIILYALSTLTTSILQGMGRLRDPLIHCAIALAAHLVLLFVLLREFSLNIYAIIYANTFFALIICVLNALTIKRVLGYRQEFYRTFFIPLIASAIMAFAAYGIYCLFHLFLSIPVATVIAIFTGALIYSFVMIVFKGITAEEVASLPKGKHILNLIRRLGLLK